MKRLAVILFFVCAMARAGELQVTNGYFPLIATGPGEFYVPFVGAGEEPPVENTNWWADFQDDRIYLLDEGSGTNVLDSGSHATHASFSSGAVWSNRNSFSGGLSITSYTAAVDLPADYLASQTNFTLSFWARRVEGNAIGVYHDSPVGIGLFVYTDGTIYCRVGNPPAEFYAYATIGSDYNYNHYAMVYDAGAASNDEKLKIYRNGIQLVLNFSTDVPAASSADVWALSIGDINQSIPCAGEVSEIINSTTAWSSNKVYDLWDLRK